MFRNLETEALDSDCPSVSNLLSIAWAHVPPIVADSDVDDAAMHELLDLVASDDCDVASREWLAAHGVRLAA